MFEKKIFNSLIKSEKVNRSELILGYLIGPSLCYLMTTAAAGNYLIQFYTDVIGISGSIVILMPIISKALAVISNIFIGRWIDRTNSVQGKARPWILISAPLLAVSGILLYSIPKSDYEIQLLWLIFSYNLFFIGANNFYVLAHSLMLPRSTTDSSARDKLAMVKNISEAMIPGTLSAVIMPLLVNKFGVGPMAQSTWFRFMLVISILAVPGCLLEYYFTTERVSDGKKDESVPFSSQLRDCLRDKRWLIFVALFTIKAVESQLSGGSMIYYCNWVLSTSVAEGAGKQVLLNVIGQLPLGIGILALMPLVKKVGKIKLLMYGYMLSIIGCGLVYFSTSNFPIVLAGMFIKSIGMLPAYLLMSLLADIIDDFENKKGYRCDTLSVTVTSAATMIASGLAQSVILLGIGHLGYIPPESASQVILQPGAIRGFFNFLMSGLHIIGYLFSFLMVIYLQKHTEKTA